MTIEAVRSGSANLDGAAILESADQEVSERRVSGLPGLPTVSVITPTTNRVKLPCEAFDFVHACLARFPLALAIRRLRHKLSGKRLVANYLSWTGTRKLQIGGGWRRLDGWLNTDLEYVPNVVQMDATQRFPFPDNTFDYIFSEHMIEHVPYRDGLSMLCECYRVMKPSGILRLVTPDLASVVSLYTAQPTEIRRRYLSYFYETFIPEGQPPNPACAVNALFHLWGHEFLYDEETLRGVMQAAGFRSIMRRRLGHSVHPELRELENQGRYPEGLLDFESVALEGCK